MVGRSRTQEIYAGDSLKLQVPMANTSMTKNQTNAASLLMAAGGRERLLADLNRHCIKQPTCRRNRVVLTESGRHPEESNEERGSWGLPDVCTGTIQDSNRYRVA
jgi:hypothetical protein